MVIHQEKKSAKMSLPSLWYGVESRILIKVPLRSMQFFPFIGSAKMVMKDISFCACLRHHIKGIWQEWLKKAEGPAPVSNFCGRAMSKKCVPCVGCSTGTGHPKCADVCPDSRDKKYQLWKWCMKGFSYNTRSNLGAWGWTLNLPSGSGSGLAGFHDTNASTCVQLTPSFLKLFLG